MTREECKERYDAAVHRMQSAVAFQIGRGGTCGSSKHLRVGINNALADQGSLAKLLVKKGLISESEYLTAIVEGMEAEADRQVEAARGMIPDGIKVDFA